MKTSLFEKLDQKENRNGERGKNALESIKH